MNTPFLFRMEMRLPGMVRPLKPIPVFKQEPGETQRRFFNRMETTVQVTKLGRFPNSNKDWISHETPGRYTATRLNQM